jgi:murein DD-endopeptidase MepM/ murein hydrolase activator NlpD
LNNPLRNIDPSGHRCVDANGNSEKCETPSRQTTRKTPPDILYDSPNANNELVQFPVASDEVTGFAYGENVPEGIHPGVDVASGRLGDPISAMAVGVVLMVRQAVDAQGNLIGFGNYIVIEHRVGQARYFSVYAHMRNNNEFNLQEGQTIERGTQIGSVGSTGHSTGAHLHFEIRKEDGMQFDANNQPQFNGYYPTQPQLEKRFVNPHDFIVQVNAALKPWRYDLP